ncbi:MAG: NYN domain-containing protein [Candidatus Uhrbacteria bacterium]|nr:NYN domain-containing protein [Candidatus Uhrbacteria bacterium]
MMKRPEQRVVVLIDTQNMYHSAKHLYGAHLNFAKLVETIVANRCLIRAVAYAATSKTGEEKGFLGALTANGIEVKSKDVIEFASGERKADWDVGIAVDAIKFSERADVVLIVSGDGDFIPLVEYLKNRGIIVEVAAFAESTSKLLKEAVDDYFDISAHADELLMTGGNRRVAQQNYVTPIEIPEDVLTDHDDSDLTLDDVPEPKHVRKPTNPTAGSGRRSVRITS